MVMATILISGGTGFIGGAIVAALRARGDRAIVLSRNDSGEDVCRWDPSKGVIDRDAVHGADGVIHLAGSPIAEGRWTDARKREILESRTRSSELLVEAVAEARRKGAGPTSFVSASAIGFYGDRGDEVVSEESKPGNGFLPDVCSAWEEATSPLDEDALDVRRAVIRIGLVLAGDGGALAKMLTPFRLGLGGPIGDGRQWMSWIHRDDLVTATLRLLDDPHCRGAYNGVAPNAVRNREFVTELGLLLRRPALLPMPGFAVRMLFGEMGQRLLLEGQRVIPARLKNIEFDWKYASIKPALKSAIRQAT